VATEDDVRRLALALPHVEEIESDGFDFRVGTGVAVATAGAGDED
jgi:hypothetical protein